MNALYEPILRDQTDYEHSAFLRSLASNSLLDVPRGPGAAGTGTTVF